MKFKDMFFKKSPFRRFSSPVDPIGTNNEDLIDEQALASQEPPDIKEDASEEEEEENDVLV